MEIDGKVCLKWSEILTLASQTPDRFWHVVYNTLAEAQQYGLISPWRELEVADGWEEGFMTFMREFEIVNDHVVPRVYSDSVTADVVVRDPEQFMKLEMEIR